MNHLQMSGILNRNYQPSIRYLTHSPMAHGAGVITLLAPIEPSFEVHVLPANRFARDPGELFRIVSSHRITTMAATSSGIAAALRVIDKRPASIDLSSLEFCSLGFEMVDAGVLDRMVEVGARLGLSPKAIGSTYGLTELGGGTGTTPGQGIRIDEVDLDALITSGIARTPTAGSPIKRVASCGIPGGLTELRVANSAGPRPERHVGELQFRGPGVMKAYVGRDVEQPFTEDGWLRTGDAGCLADGKLFVTGRIKEVIVQHGKKCHPEDIEWAAAQGADIAPGECVAFTPVGADKGDVVIAVETALTDGLADLEQRVRAAVINRVGITPRSVIFVAPATLPKTSSGKAQRLAARDRYARGELTLNR